MPLKGAIMKKPNLNAKIATKIKYAISRHQILAQNIFDTEKDLAEYLAETNTMKLRVSKTPLCRLTNFLIWLFWVKTSLILSRQ